MLVYYVGNREVDPMTQEERNTASVDGYGRVAYPELVEDPDSDLELREDFSTELQI